jgi:hypothetical protein
MQALFHRAHFAEYAWFLEAQFGHAGFEDTQFASYAWFDGAHFIEYALFREEQFPKSAVFDGARVASDARHVVLPAGWDTHTAQIIKGEEQGWLYVVREDSGKQPETPSHEET